MSRKLLAIGSVLLGTIFSMGAFAACATTPDDGGKNEQHEHTYSTTWSYDQTNHWYAATCEHKSETKDRAMHTFGDDGTCSVCGYKKNEDIVTPTPSEEIPDKEVKSIAIKTQPTKLEYYVDDVLSLEGGVITITFTDGDTFDVPMTHPDIEISNVNMAMAGTKTITVKYKAKKATFKITVRAASGATITFDQNYEGAPAAETQKVLPGYTSTKPSTQPDREGYTFYNWYVDRACTVPFEFGDYVTSDITIYAQWKAEGETYYTVNYSMNYYGCRILNYEQIVKSGESARTVAISPERIDYSFTGWFADEAATTLYDAASAINADTTIYAGWNKTKTGVTEYIFEAEHTDLSGKRGPGYSGENAGRTMIGSDEQGLGASGGRFVSYMYKDGNSLEFELACDEDVSDVTLSVRLAAEYYNVVLTSDNYEISVNGVAQKFDTISLAVPEGKTNGPFQDFVISVNVTLKKGHNTIQLKTNNSDALGGTMEATAPVIDCIKIKTSAVVIWDGTYSLPVEE